MAIVYPKNFLFATMQMFTIIINVISTKLKIKLSIRSDRQIIRFDVLYLTLCALLYSIVLKYKYSALQVIF